LQYALLARLFSNGNLVYERTDSPAFSLPATPGNAASERPFLYEDRMPVVPGAYRLAVTAQNKVTGDRYEATREFTVENPGDRAVLSEILITPQHRADSRPQPFQFAGVKFLPTASGRIVALRGLRVCYQLTTAASPSSKSLDVEYVIGGVVTKIRTSLQETLQLTRADASGSLLVAKTLPIESLAPGPYHLVVRLRDPQSGRISARSAAFTVVDTVEQNDPVIVSRQSLNTPAWQAAADYERALCWLAQGRRAEAVSALESSWRISRSPAVQALLQQLKQSPGAGLPVKKEQL
jgi:hypothetical protein